MLMSFSIACAATMSADVSLRFLPPLRARAAVAITPLSTSGGTGPLSRCPTIPEGMIATGCLTRGIKICGTLSAHCIAFRTLMSFRFG